MEKTFVETYFYKIIYFFLGIGTILSIIYYFMEEPPFFVGFFALIFLGLCSGLMVMKLGTRLNNIIGKEE